MNLSWGFRRWALLASAVLITATLALASVVPWKCVVLVGVIWGIAVLFDEWSGWEEK